MNLNLRKELLNFWMMPAIHQERHQPDSTSTTLFFSATVQKNIKKLFGYDFLSPGSWLYIDANLRSPTSSYGWWYFTGKITRDFGKGTIVWLKYHVSCDRNTSPYKRKSLPRSKKYVLHLSFPKYVTWNQDIEKFIPMHDKLYEETVHTFDRQRLKIKSSAQFTCSNEVSFTEIWPNEIKIFWIDFISSPESSLFNFWCKTVKIPAVRKS